MHKQHLLSLLMSSFSRGDALRKQILSLSAVFVSAERRPRFESDNVSENAALMLSVYTPTIISAKNEMIRFRVCGSMRKCNTRNLSLPCILMKLWTYCIVYHDKWGAESALTSMLAL